MLNDVFLSELCTLLNVDIAELDLEASFIQNGGHSLSAAALVSICNTSGCQIDRKTLLSNKPLRDVLDAIQAGETTTTTLSAAVSEPTSLSQVPLEMEIPLRQQSFLPYEVSETSSPSLVDLSRSTHSLSSATTFSLGDNDAFETNIIQGKASLQGDEETSRLTEMQVSFIHGSIKSPGTNIIAYSERYFTIDLPKIKAAWRTVIEMESVFHTPALDEFREAGKGVFSWTETSTPLSEPEIYDRIEKIRSKGKLECSFHVFPHQTRPNEESTSTLLLIIHHAFVDGFSAALLKNKMQRLTAKLDVEPSPPFSDFIDNLVELKQSRMDEGNQFWYARKDFMSSTSGHLLLAASFTEIHSFKSEEVSIDLTRLQYSLPRTAKDLSITSPAMFYAAWALVLSKYVGTHKPVFGAVLSGRDLPLTGIREICGPTLNTLPFAVEIDSNATTQSFLSTVMTTLSELSEFQWTSVKNGFANEYESAVAIQFESMRYPEGSITPVGVSRIQQATELPLSVIVEPGRKVRLVYHISRYNKIDMERVAACYFQALQMLVQKVMTVEQILQGLMPLSAREKLYSYGNVLSEKTTRQSVTEDLVTLFERTARNYPLQAAVRCGNSLLTYAEYDRAASQLAEHLSATTKPGDVICVHADRSINWIVAIYGILKVRAVYCSLDEGLPSDLRNIMFNNAAARHFVVPRASQKIFTPSLCDHVIAIDEVLTNNTEQRSFTNRSTPDPWATAYLCYTSGSTGKPKGVQCTHEGLVAFQSSLKVRLFSQPGIKISQIMSPAFDGSIHEIFSSLCHGGCLVLPNEGDPFGHLDIVDSAILTPSIAAALDPQRYPRLKYLYLVGEPVSQYVNDKWSADRQLYNMYGPTEGTCGATIKRLYPGRKVTIGGPNPTTRIYILDPQARMVSPGVVGEIYLAGIQIAQGYLKLPEETFERFLPDTVVGNGEMMYKTGDKGYWDEAGEIVCLGRNDRQVKLRGYRLDMNDLEIRAARALPEIEIVAIAPQKDYLVAMVQPESIDIRKLTQRLSKIFPSYAIPRHIAAVAKIPTTRAGKVDYKALSASTFTALAESTRGLTTPTERLIAAAYRRVLDLGDSGAMHAQSNFIDLGGHSLHQLTLSMQLGRELGTRIPLRLIIENPSVEALAAAVDSFRLKNEGHTVSSEKQISDQSVSFTEGDWLRRYRFDSGSSCFNVAFATTFKNAKVDRSRLADAWDHVLSRHLILRCRYVSRYGWAPRRICSECPPRTERVKSLDLWTEINRPFQLDRNAPIRVLISQDKLIVVMSHIVSDYTTLAILLREASIVYKGGMLQSVKHTYLDALRSRDTVKPCQLNFWATYLNGCTATPELFGRNTEREGYRGISAVSKLSQATSRKLLAFSRSSKYTLQQLATAAVAIALQRDASSTDIVINTPYLNRSTEESLDTVGLFLEPLPVRVRYDGPQESHGENSLPEITNPKYVHRNQYLEAVRSSSQIALAHAVPWHHLLELLAIPKVYPNHPISDVTVSFHDVAQTKSLSLGAEGEFEPCFLWSEGSKFKLMVEFAELESGTIMLRLEYDPTCVQAKEAGFLRWALPAALGWLSDGLDYLEIKRRLNENSWEDFDDADCGLGSGRGFLGVAMSAL